MKTQVLVAVLLLRYVNSGLRFVTKPVHKILSTSSNLIGWKPYLNATQPFLDGISGGTNQLKEEIYVGLATFKSQTSPAELIISGENIGLHFPYGRKVEHLKSNLKYYAKESDCEYKWVAKGGGVDQAIQVLSPPYNFYIGRVFSFESYHVCSVNLQHRVFYYGLNGTTRTSASYEVLTCKRSYTTRNPNPMGPIATSSWRNCSLEWNEMKADMQTLKAQIDELKALTAKYSQANSTVEVKYRNE